MPWSSVPSKPSARRRVPARSATARSSSQVLNRRSVSALASPASTRFSAAKHASNLRREGRTMKLRFNAAFGGLAGTVALVLPVLALAADDKPKLDSGDTAWMLTSTALVLMMTIPGLALFYGGMVRKKNVLATVMQSFAVACLISVLWLVVGYSLAFTPGSTIIGGLSRVFLRGPRLHTVYQSAQPITQTTC